MNWNEIYRVLKEYYGPIQWWAPDEAFEVVVGAVLTQNTSWQAVEKAIANLKQANRFSLQSLAGCPPEQMEQLIRPAGYYRIKTKRLQNLLRFINDRYGSLEKMFKTPMDTLRTELLEVNGIGPETADSILLYAGQMPSFVVDTYTRRILQRHNWMEKLNFPSQPGAAQYEAIRNSFMNDLEPHPGLMGEFHAFIVETAKEFCGKNKANCESCPLRRFLP